MKRNVAETWFDRKDGIYRTRGDHTPLNRDDAAYHDTGKNLLKLGLAIAALALIVLIHVGGQAKQGDAFSGFWAERQPSQ